MDVKNTFLNGDLVEEVYMRPPSVIDHPKGMSINFKKPFIVLNRLHGLGSRSLAPQLCLLYSLCVTMIMDFSHVSKM